MKNALDGEAWSTAIEGFKSYLRPSPGDIMDKLRSGSMKSGYATVCIRSLLPGSHAGTPWEYNSDNPSIDLKKRMENGAQFFSASVVCMKLAIMATSVWSRGTTLVI